MVEAIELGAGIKGGESPGDGGLGRVAVQLPGGDGAAQDVGRGVAHCQAVSRECRQLDLGHVEPTGVDGSEVEAELASDAPCLSRRVGLVEGPELVG